jgi:hypothetical protein
VFVAAKTSDFSARMMSVAVEIEGVLAPSTVATALVGWIMAPTVVVVWCDWPLVPSEGRNMAEKALLTIYHQLVLQVGVVGKWWGLFDKARADDHRSVRRTVEQRCKRPPNGERSAVRRRRRIKMDRKKSRSYQE